jgi:hypothetical protein
VSPDLAQHHHPRPTTAIIEPLLHSTRFRAQRPAEIRHRIERIARTPHSGEWYQNASLAYPNTLQNRVDGTDEGTYPAPIRWTKAQPSVTRFSSIFWLLVPIRKK